MNEGIYDIAMKRNEAERAKWVLLDEDYLNLLAPDEQLELLNYILGNTIYDEVYKYNIITKHNSHVVAKELFDSDIEVAKALYEELKVYMDDK